jgi:ribonucleoside-triphosphate reductase
VAAEEPAPAEEEKKPAGKRIVLFATRTCPNCRMARVFLDKAGVEYGEIIADEHKELCDRFGVNSAPTLIVVGQEGYEKIVNVSNIKKYINEELVKH